MFVSEDITKSDVTANILLGMRVRNIDMSTNILSIFFILVFGLFNVCNMIAIIEKGRKKTYNQINYREVLEEVFFEKEGTEV